MIPGMSTTGGFDLGPRSTLREIVNAVGLSSKVRVILDAGDRSSYASGSTWLDLSGSGYDFVRAFLAPASAGPTFSGTAGGQSSSEYWQASNYFSFMEYDSANETWMNAIHKANGVVTIAGWFSLSSANSMALVDTSGGNPSNVGFAWGTHLISSPTSTLEFVIHNGSGLGGSASSGLTPSTSGFQFLAVSVSAAAGTWVMQSGSSQASGSISYTSPSSSNATNRMATTCGATSGAAGKVGELVIGDTALTAAELTRLYDATKGRY